MRKRLRSLQNRDIEGHRSWCESQMLLSSPVKPERPGPSSGVALWPRRLRGSAPAPPPCWLFRRSPGRLRAGLSAGSSGALPAVLPPEAPRGRRPGVSWRRIDENGRCALEGRGAGPGGGCGRTCPPRAHPGKSHLRSPTEGDVPFTQLFKSFMGTRLSLGFLSGGVFYQ